MAAAACVPFFLVAVSRGPLMVRDHRRRFGAACALAIGIWLLAVLAGDEFWRFDSKAIGDLLAGIFIILSGALTTLIVWLLVASGVSVNLLVSLAAKPGPVDVDAWLATYGDGFGVDDLFRDRLSLLHRTGAVAITPSTVSLARGARLPATILSAAMLYFNFSRSFAR